MNENYAKSYNASKASDGLILNTFADLERESLAYLKSTFLGQQPVWAVGPLLPINDGNSRGGPSSVPTSDVMTWLDSCHVDKSVVYVCFGSQINLTGAQMEVLADALDKSGVRFIWVVKDPMRGVQVAGDEQNLIPLGFKDRVARRGLVIRGWAPQVAILGHRAVGSYLTHCGWNSALEGLLAETLLLVWPMQADHFENEKLLVDGLRVSVRVCEGLETVPNAVELARILTESVGSTRPERARAMELRRVALDSTKPSGSSHRALDELVKDLWSFLRIMVWLPTYTVESDVFNGVRTIQLPIFQIPERKSANVNAENVVVRLFYCSVLQSFTLSYLATMANAHKFISEFTNRYRTLVGGDTFRPRKYAKDLPNEPSTEAVASDGGPREELAPRMVFMNLLQGN
ncbi:hypothetical protein TIFTF001_023459 [Ficus carica]|uniref:Uncharacterized protein n=1 Tax=Ficus carica TaxID=3494 RepID=A0AA88B022_FICCA|nr:hypothetical protein TIFTF001_023459 [Ficus carica]